MPVGVSNGHYQMGWRDVGDYLAQLRDNNGRRWTVHMSVTGELSNERRLLLGLCCCGGHEGGHGAGCVPTVASWPDGNGRGLAATVWDMCYRADRVMAEIAQEAERQSAF